MTRIVIDPVTRIEGHLKIEATTEDGVVREARCSGMLFRGFELILRGRDPRDASCITQRICGVCPTSHAVASALALDDAFGIAGQVPTNGRVMRNLILGSNYIQSHILHFYHLAALDFVDVAAAAQYTGSDERLRQVADFISRGQLAPFFPRYEGDYRLSRSANQAAVSHYVEALDKRREAQEMLAIFGGKMPHNMSTFPGGALEEVTINKITAFRGYLEHLREFIDDVYIPDVLLVARAYPDYFEIGRGPGRYLSYGVWDQSSEPDLTARERYVPNGTVDSRNMAPESFDASLVTEQVRHSWYASESDLHPSLGATEPDPRKSGAYSFLKSPRYDGKVHEVGPLSRMVVAYVREHPEVRPLVDSVLSELGAGPEALFSVLGRHATRAIECKVIADAMVDWVLELKPGEPACAPFELPESGEGVGLTEAPRGALGHWIRIEDGVIADYQAVVPSTWNFSPRDDSDRPGPCEQALEGAQVRDEGNPFELTRIVRSFDPCLACAIHIVTPKGDEIARFRAA